MMRQRVNRRAFLQQAGAVVAGTALADLGTPNSRADDAARGAPNAARLGWRLGCQAWTFHDFTFFEAVDKTASLGLQFIEGFPKQKLSPDKPELTLGDKLPAAARNEVKKRLADSGVKIVSFGVVSYPPGGLRPTFDFAKEMGIENIVAEPPFNAFDGIDKLCQEYDINLALHDHPKPSPYWDPATVLRVCKGRSKRIGACCDTGHWMRSGIDVLGALKMLEGRIIEFHFKDLNEFGNHAAHDVPWGTGKGDLKAWLVEVKRQGVKPFFAVEYEHNWGHSLPDIARSVKYFDQVCGELAGS
jgi:sugar phosphate isomerase/epimerase